ncbi:hypothetical protein CFAM422_004455, partial [Trichoderma lentiforme]
CYTIPASFYRYSVPYFFLHTLISRGIVRVAFVSAATKVNGLFPLGLPIIPTTVGPPSPGSRRLLHRMLQHYNHHANPAKPPLPSTLCGSCWSGLDIFHKKKLLYTHIIYRRRNFTLAQKRQSISLALESTEGLLRCTFNIRPRPPWPDPESKVPTFCTSTTFPSLLLLRSENSIEFLFLSSPTVEPFFAHCSLLHHLLRGVETDLFLFFRVSDGFVTARNKSNTSIISLQPLKREPR